MYNKQVNKLTDNEIIKAVKESGNKIFAAAKLLQVPYTSFRRKYLSILENLNLEEEAKKVKSLKDNPLSEKEFNQHEDITKEQCIDSLVNIQKQNPEKDITRNFFRNNSGIADSDWTQFFGSFNEFKNQANLNSSRQVKAFERNIAKHVSNEHYENLNYRHSLDNLYNKEVGGRYKTMLIASDFHDEEADKFSLDMFLEVARQTQPDIIVLNGDLFDLPEFGRWGTDPRNWDVVGRIKYAHSNVLIKLRLVCPNSQIDLIEGNHEARLVKHLGDQSPAMRAVLSDFVGMGVEDLFRLTELNINYVAKANLKAWTKSEFNRELEKNHKVYFDTLLCHHFPVGSKLGLPGTNGHHHSYHAQTLSSYDRGSYTWIQTGSIHARTAEYCDGDKWSNGFLLAHVDTKDKKVVFEYIDTTNEIAVFAGKFYNRNDFDFKV